MDNLRSQRRCTTSDRKKGDAQPQIAKANRTLRSTQSHPEKGPKTSGGPPTAGRSSEVANTRLAMSDQNVEVVRDQHATSPQRPSGGSSSGRAVRRAVPA